MTCVLLVKHKEAIPKLSEPCIIRHLTDRSGKDIQELLCTTVYLSKEVCYFLVEGDGRRLAPSIVTILSKRLRLGEKEIRKALADTAKTKSISAVARLVQAKEDI